MRNPLAEEGQAMRTDVNEKITNQIVSELQKGAKPWHQPSKAELGESRRREYHYTNCNRNSHPTILAAR